MHHVRISSVGSDEWYVEVGAGHYNNPLSKEAAIQEALHIAEKERLEDIGIYDETGKLLETRTVPNKAREDTRVHAILT
jgi:hypothetical protein